MVAPAAAAARVAARRSATKVGAARGGAAAGGARLSRAEINKLPAGVRDQVLSQLGDAAADAVSGDDKKDADKKDKPRPRRRSSRGRLRGAARTGAERVTRPALSATSTVTMLVVGALTLVLLYQLLRFGNVVDRVLTGVQSAAAWLGDPTASIPYAPDY